MKSRKLPDFDRLIQSVDTTDVNRCWRSKLKPYYSGYAVLRRKGGAKVRAHRLSWELFWGPIPQGVSCCHHCDNRGCANPYHLFLGTHKDNMQDALKKGRLKTRKGEEAPACKTTAVAVLEMRERNANGESQTSLADRFGLDVTTVNKIISRKLWKHI